MGLLNNHKINEIPDEELEADLSNNRLTLESKTAEILELVRRRITDSIAVMKNLNQSVLRLEQTIVALNTKDEKLQKRILVLTVVGIVLAALQAIGAVKIVLEWMR